MVASSSMHRLRGKQVDPNDDRSRNRVRPTGRHRHRLQEWHRYAETSRYPTPLRILAGHDGYGDRRWPACHVIIRWTVLDLDDAIVRLGEAADDVQARDPRRSRDKGRVRGHLPLAHRILDREASDWRAQ